MKNISNLLRYDPNHIQYKYQAKTATLSAQQNMPTHELHTNGPELSMHTEHPEIQLDGSDFFASIGLFNMSDLMANAAEEGRQAVLEAMRNYAETANQLGDIEKGVTPATIAYQKMLAQVHTSLVVKSAEPIHISCIPGSVQIDYTPGNASINWDVERAIRRYTPAQLDVEILQPPSMQFTYTGGFHYVPESGIPGFDRTV